MATADEPPPRTVITAKAFERDLKRLRKRGVDLEPLWVVVETIRLGHPPFYADNHRVQFQSVEHAFSFRIAFGRLLGRGGG